MPEPLLLTPRGLWDLPPDQYPMGVWLEPGTSTDYCFRYRLRSSLGETSKIDSCRSPLVLLVCRNRCTVPFVKIEGSYLMNYRLHLQSFRTALGNQDDALLCQSVQSLWRMDWTRLPPDPVRDGLLMELSLQGLRASRCSEEGFHGWANPENVAGLTALLETQGCQVEIYR